MVPDPCVDVVKVPDPCAVLLLRFLVPVLLCLGLMWTVKERLVIIQTELLGTRQTHTYRQHTMFFISAPRHQTRRQTHTQTAYNVLHICS